MERVRDDAELRRSAGAAIHISVLLAAASLVALYAALRYGGLWGDSDTHVFSTAVRAMLAEGSLITEEEIYANGYGYPVLVLFLMHVTGLSVVQLQIAGGALLSVWVILPAWLAYRELTGSARGASLATVILLIQPEFLFPILRGSHEKFTRGFMFVCLYLLVRSIAVRHHSRRFTAYLIAFYLTAFALIAFNNLMAASFVIALALTLVLSWGVRLVLGPQADDSAATRRRLLYAIAVTLVLAFLFVFYAYPPARYGLSILDWVGDSLTWLMLNVRETTANPYQTVFSGWISLPVYLLVSGANWLLLALSFVLWLALALAMWRGRARSQGAGARAHFLWSLYGAFGLLGAVSIAVDFTGVLGSNLQHRVFPSFAMIAAALVSVWAVGKLESKPHMHRLLHAVLAVGLGFLGVVSVMKATNEPLVSNKWQYYSPLEKSALLWSEAHSDTGALWTGLDERLTAAMGICCPEEFSNLTLRGGAPRPDVRDYLLSDIVRARAGRLEFALPIAADSLRVYDNGQAEVYHLRPQTPFQR
jgi:hypothetical protein